MIYCKHPLATISQIATTIYSRYFKNPWKLEQLFLSFYRLLQWINYCVYPKTLCVHVCHTFLHAINRLFCCCCSEISRFLCCQKLFFNTFFFFFFRSLRSFGTDHATRTKKKNSSLMHPASAESTTQSGGWWESPTNERHHYGIGQSPTVYSGKKYVYSDLTGANEIRSFII